jgi:hypothetical protein
MICILVSSMLMVTLIFHCLLMYIKHYSSQVFCFFSVGFVIGLFHVVLSLILFGFTEDTMVSILIFAAICHFILNIISLTTNGISISVLEQLSIGSFDMDTINSKFSITSLTLRRITQLRNGHFLIQNNDKLYLSLKGEKLVWIFLKLRKCFGHGHEIR